MRIGIACNVLNRNTRGFATYVRQLVHSLACTYSDLEIVLYSDQLLDEFSGYPNITVRCIPRRMKTFFWRNIRLPLCALRDKIEIMHFPDNSVWLFPWTRTVVTLHDISPLTCRQYRLTTRWMLGIIRIVYFFIKHTAKIIITDSVTSKKDIERCLGLDENKVVDIPLYCDKEFIRQPQELWAKELSEFDLGEQFVLFVGGIDPRKNIVRLVEAVQIVRRRWKKDITLVIAGDYKRNPGIHFTRRSQILYDDEVREFVRLIGFQKREKLVSLYNAATVHVLPSFYEGFGLTVLESMACGTPVIVSDRPWGHEITGGNALFVDPESAVDIAEKILLILKNQHIADSLREKATVHFNNFSASQTAQQTYGVYASILNR